MKIAMANAIVNNPVEARRLYSEVLGFTTRMFVPEANLAILVSPKNPGGTGLLLEPNDNPIGAQNRFSMTRVAILSRSPRSERCASQREMSAVE